MVFNARNAILDFSPLSNALGAYTQGVNQAETVRLAREKEAQQRQSYNALLADPSMGLSAGYRNVLAGMQPAEGRKAIAGRMAEREKAQTRPWWAGSQPGEVDPSYLAAKRAGASKTTVNMPAQETAFDKEAGKEFAKSFVESQKTLGTATRTMGELKVLESALADPNLYTGTGARWIGSMKKAAGTLFGVNVQGVSSMEVAENIAKSVALGNRTMLPGPMSNADRQFLEEMAPNITKTPEGNRQILAIAMTGKQYEIDRARAHAAYASRNNGRIDAGIYAELRKIDEQYAQRYGELIGELRGMAPAPNRSPAVGTPAQGGYDRLRQIYKGLE